MWPPEVAPNRYTLATHHATLAVDINEFGSRDRSTHLHLRAALYQIVRNGCEAVGLTWRDVYHEDRGDGILLVMPSQVSVELLLGPITALMHAGVRRHNRMANAMAQIRVRAAVNAGYLQFDAFGVTGHTLIHLFRLLNSDAFTTLLGEHGADLGLVTSQPVYEEVILQEPTLIDPLAFERIEIENKETTAVAWVWLPRAQPAGMSHFERRRRVSGR